jgi:O-glycosyl hydrolase
MTTRRSGFLLLALAAAACAGRAPATQEVSIEPASVSLDPGGQQTFSAAGFGVGATVTWSIQEGSAGGEISSSGVYTAPDVEGQFHIVASAPPLQSVALVQVHAKPKPPPGQPPVEISPSAVNLTPSGTYQFSATAATGNPHVTWSVAETNGGDITSAGLYTAPAATGIFHVIATSTTDASNSASATVTVSAVPEVTVAVSPSAVSLLAAGAAAFSAIVTGTADTSVAWSIDQGALGGSVDSHGNYLAPATGGTYHIVATSNADPSKSGAATVTVASIDVAVTPHSANVLHGATQGFGCGVTGTAITGCNWSVQEGAAGGTISSNGTYTPPAGPGTFHVVAASSINSAVTDVAAITVPPIAVSVTPGSATVAFGGSASFSCSISGSTDTGCAWSIAEGAAGGNISASGAYTPPGSAGTYHVVATSHADPTKTASVAVTVTPASVAIGPTSATVPEGGSTTFSCTATGAADTGCTFSVAEAGGGSVTSSGVYTAPNSAGTYHVVATSHADPTKTASAVVTVTPPSVNINPTSAMVALGGSASFTCAVTGVADTGCTFSVAEAGGGSVNSSGAYTAPTTAGTYHVVATSHADASRTASAAVTVTAAGISINPTTPTVALGGSQTFTCTVIGAADTSCTWSVTEAGGGSISAGGVYTAPITAGTYHVVAASHADPTKTASTAVTVGPAAISISPTTATLSEGGSKAFSCSVTGAVDTGCTWSIAEGASGGSVSATGAYTAPNSGGTFHVVATSHVDPTKTATAVVTVTPPSVSINPASAIVALGGSANFTCAVTGAADTSCTFSVAEAGGGSVSATGAYTAPTTAGTYHVVATSHADASRTASAAVTVTAAGISISPTILTIALGGSANFTCTVTGAADTACTWSVTEANGGSISASGVYTAPTIAGIYHVVATSHADPTKTASTAVTVNPAAISISPATATVSEGGAQIFACSVTGAVDTGCTWSITEGATGGTVSTTGAYTAPNTAGTYHVVATSHVDPTKTATATVTVAPPSVSISPASPSLLAGGTQTFTCAVTGAADTSCTWSIQEGSTGGVINSSGSYIAPVSGGTFHVIATSHADATRSATATVTVSPASVSIGPTSATVLPAATQIFTCAVTGAADTGCTFSMLESVSGTVDSNGIYTAPAVAGTYHVIAKSHADPTKTSTATVTVPISVAISPKTASLAPSAQQSFTCAILGSTDQTCTWSVSEGAAGGSVTSTGVYTAPGAGGTYHVVAASHADPTRTDTASVSVTQGQDILVDFTEPQQSIDGFGAADVWVGNLTSAQADMFFCVNAGGPCASGGIGLSLLRAGIDSSGSYRNGAWNNAKLASARGAKVWAAPWSPTASYKTTGNINTGSLNTGSYDAWASVLAAFPGKLKTQTGVDLYALSVQNEPDYNTNGAYEMCLYTGQQMVNFINVLGPKLAALNPRPQLLAAETSTWGNLWPSYGSLIAADPTASGYIDIYASHQYDYSNPSNPIPSGKRLWETEVSSFDGPSTDIGNGIAVGKWIHGAMTVANANAWHYWWLISLNNDNEGLLNKGGVLTSRYYVLGNYSKFVRPGWVRVTTAGGPASVYASAYRDPATGNFAVVVINDTGGNVTQRFTFNGGLPGSVTPNVTSSTLNLAPQTAVDASSGSFTVTLGTQTVTTFVGTAH